MEDFISRQKAIDALKEKVFHNLSDEFYGAMQVLDELPSIQPDTTTDGSNVVKKGGNDEDRTSGDCISRQQSVDTLRKMQTYKLFAGDDMLLIDQAEAQTELMMLPSVQPERPTGEWIQKPRYEDDEYPDARPNLKCPFCGYEIGWCDMGNYCARCGFERWCGMRLIDADAAIESLTEYGNGRAVYIGVEEAVRRIEQLPSAQPEQHEIGYSECANAMLKMWIDNVLTDGEYNRIMDKLNAHWAERREE